MAYTAIFPGCRDILEKICFLSSVRPPEKSISFGGKSTYNPKMQVSSSEHIRCLLEKYGNSILRLAYSYLHNMADAEDILQDTMIQYIDSRPSFDNLKLEKAWLMRVAANLSKNKIRYNKLRETDELEDNLKGPEKEDLAFVWDAVKQLPVKYREVIHLFYYEEFSTSQISKILARKESTVRSDLRRGRQALKKILKEEYDFER